MTHDEKLVMAALDKFGGDRKLAAVILDKSDSCIDQHIWNCDELKAKYGKGNHLTTPPTQAEALHRGAGNGDGRLPTDDRNLVISMVKEDKMLAEGLERLGLTPQEVQRAIGFRDFSKNQFVESVQIVGASMTTICVQLSTQIQAVMDRLAGVRERLKDCNPLYRMNLVDEEKYLSESLIGMAEQIRRMSDTAHRGMMLQAMIRYRLLGLRTTKQTAAMKPGFSTEIPVEARRNYTAPHDP